MTGSLGLKELKKKSKSIMPPGWEKQGFSGNINHRKKRLTLSRRKKGLRTLWKNKGKILPKSGVHSASFSESEQRDRAPK